MNYVLKYNLLKTLIFRICLTSKNSKFVAFECYRATDSLCSILPELEYRSIQSSYCILHMTLSFCLKRKKTDYGAFIKYVCVLELCSMHKMN